MAYQKIASGKKAYMLIIIGLSVLCFFVSYILRKNKYVSNVNYLKLINIFFAISTIILAIIFWFASNIPTRIV
jgi:hypothetical protein